MITAKETIQKYQESKLSLVHLQEYLWGLSESELETIPEEQLIILLNE